MLPPDGDIYNRETAMQLGSKQSPKGQLGGTGCQARVALVVVWCKSENITRNGPSEQKPRLTGDNVCPTHTDSTFTTR